MDIKDYKEAIRKAAQTYESVLKSIKETYALANNPVEKGDIVELHRNRIVVDTIQTYYPYPADVPRCKYVGWKLRKDLIPFKDGSRDAVYQDDKMTVIKAVDL